MIDTLQERWNQFADLTYDPKFIRRLRRAVGLLALAVTLGWLVSCTALGIMASNARGQEPTPTEEAYYTLYFPLPTMAPEPPPMPEPEPPEEEL